VLSTRAGALDTAINSPPTIPAKIVLIGHSFGSAITNALLAKNSTIADGAVLTDWSFNSGLQNIYGLAGATIQLRLAFTLDRDNEMSMIVVTFMLLISMPFRKCE